ncbi:MAG: GDSL-type esterase/lipase family protein [Chitinophagaceae bacterium]
MKKILVTALVVVLSGSLFAQDTAHHAKPVFVSKEITRVGFNQLYHYKIEAFDSANYPLSFSVKKLPAWLKYDPVTHIISGKSDKAGQWMIGIEAADKYSTVRQNFMLTVYDDRTKNILCLGNSITNGTSKYNSYRRSLWQLLHAANYNFDFVGSWSKHHMGGDVPDPDFDMDHDGHSGWRFDDIFHAPSWDSARGNIYEWLKVYKPDIVLMELGTNDVFQCRTVADMVKDLNQLITLLRAKNNDVKIFLAQIPPLGKQWAQKKLCGDSTDYDNAIQNLNKAFAEFADKNTNKQSPVVLVDQYSDINTDTEMYDDIHPNEKGERIMAEKWFKAIIPYLTKLKN